MRTWKNTVSVRRSVCPDWRWAGWAGGAQQRNTNTNTNTYYYCYYPVRLVRLGRPASRGRLASRGRSAGRGLSSSKHRGDLSAKCPGGPLGAFKTLLLGGTRGDNYLGHQGQWSLLCFPDVGGPAGRRADWKETEHRTATRPSATQSARDEAERPQHCTKAPENTNAAMPGDMHSRQARALCEVACKNSPSPKGGSDHKITKQITFRLSNVTFSLDAPFRIPLWGTVENARIAARSRSCAN